MVVPWGKALEKNNFLLLDFVVERQGVGSTSDSKHAEEIGRLFWSDVCNGNDHEFKPRDSYVVATSEKALYGNFSGLDAALWEKSTGPGALIT